MHFDGRRSRWHRVEGDVPGLSGDFFTLFTAFSKLVSRFERFARCPYHVHTHHLAFCSRVQTISCCRNEESPSTICSTFVFIFPPATNKHTHLTSNTPPPYFPRGTPPWPPPPRSGAPTEKERRHNTTSGRTGGPTTGTEVRMFLVSHFPS